ncbi:hypothetical protein ACFZA2_02010 [Microbacterium sp. NPDC007973]|uniref:hypothetical protein n=1 Tax=Microbacterium sp. NPDC007973 TaxID=3364182 RepID=UPI0036E018A7
MTVVIGLDTSLTTTGVARVDLGVGGAGQVEAVRWGTAQAKAPAPSRSTPASERRRLRVMTRAVLAHVPERVDLVVLEGPAPGAKFSGKADERSGLRWMLIDQLVPRTPTGEEVVLIDPQTRAVLAWGKGMPRRKKGQSSDQAKAPVLAAVRARVTGADVADHNIADAVALAEAGAHFLGMAVEYSAAQVSAHAKVAWPVGGPLVPARSKG